MPSRISGAKGSLSHSSSDPGGTTSVWPAKQNTGPPFPRRAQRLVTSPKGRCSISKSAACKRSANNSWQPASSGVTDARRIRASVNSSVVLILIFCRYLFNPQQFVYRDFCTCLRVNPLHDDRTIQTAHKHIASNWQSLTSGDIIDVEYILNETKEKKISERLEVY